MTDNGPGFIALIGARQPECRDDQARLVVEVDERRLNPAGAVHGGMLATLVDATMGAAVRSSVDDGDAPATSQLTITYLRPGRIGELSVSAKVSKRRRVMARVSMPPSIERPDVVLQTRR